MKEGPKDIVVTAMNKGILNHHLSSTPLSPPEVCGITRTHNALVPVRLQDPNEALCPLPGLKNHVVSNLKEVLVSIGERSLEQLIPHTSRRVLAPRDNANLESTLAQVVCIPKEKGIIVVNSHVDLVRVCWGPGHLKAREKGTNQVAVFKSLPTLAATTDGYEKRNTHASRL
jgi:hypothetical protein